MEGGMKNYRFRLISRFISKTVQATAILTMTDEQELVCDLPSGAISINLEWVPVEGHSK